MLYATNSYKTTNLDKFYKDAKWRVEFVFFPRVCDRTGNIIWFELAYHGITESVSLVTGKPKVEHRWLRRDEFMSTKADARTQ